MLPSTGYFKTINCPLFEQDKCNRIYCHFKHKKLEAIINYVPMPIQQLKKQNESNLEYEPIPFVKLKKTDDIEMKKNIENDNNEKINKEIKSSNDLENNKVDLDFNIYKSIESKLSSIFQDNKSDDKKDECEDVKKDDCSSIEELDKATKETKAKKDQQDNDIVVKQERKQKNIELIGDDEQIEDECLNPVTKKARIAHKAGDNVNPSINALLPAKKSIRMSPAQVMVSRFAQLSKDKQQDNQSTKTIAKIQESNISTNSSNSKKRIAHTPTINKIDNSGVKRPVLPLELGSKVPNIIRQRYLNSLIDECLKVCKETEEAYQKALNEELAIYKRSPSKQSYINLVAIGIKRIRDSIKSKVT